MGKLILVRHGETNKNIGKILHSPQDSESLNTKGINQILDTAKRLSAFLPNKMYSSNEKRSLESSKIISEKLNIPFEEINDLQERNWGIFTGKPWDEVSKVLNPMLLEERYNYVPENGESWKTFETRLIKAIRTITNTNSDKTIVVVTHGGAIRALMPFLLGAPEEESFKYDPSNASLSIFNFAGDRFTQVVIDDISHLNS